MSAVDWTNLAARYNDRVLLVCRSILRDESLSRDAAQDAMLKLARSNGDVRDWDAWALTVAGNTARDYLRRARRAPEPLDSDRVDAAAPAPDAALIAKESTQRIAAALEGLPEGDRSILLLKFREGLSGPQIASALGISLEAAWQRLSRALKALRAKLGGDHE